MRTFGLAFEASSVRATQPIETGLRGFKHGSPLFQNRFACDSDSRIVSELGIGARGLTGDPWLEVWACLNPQALGRHLQRKLIICQLHSVVKQRENAIQLELCYRLFLTNRGNDRRIGPDRRERDKRETHAIRPNNGRSIHAIET